MFGNAPRAVWDKWFPPDEQNRIDLACRAMLIEIDDKKILCETGIGAFMDPKLADRYGVQTPHRHVLLESLGALGFSPDDVDYVILSHLHFDHAGGLLPRYEQAQAGDNDLIFKKAQFITSKEAFARAEQPHMRDKASFIPGLSEKLKQSGRLILNDRPTIDGFFTEHISFFFSDGHTPGQMHTICKGAKGQRALLRRFNSRKRLAALARSPWDNDRFPEKLIRRKVRTLWPGLSRLAGFLPHESKFVCSGIPKATRESSKLSNPLPT